MTEMKIYSASADIAERANKIETAYRTKDGRFIISESDLRDFRFHLKPEEYVTGLDVVLLSKDEAKRLIAENGYAIGREQAAATPTVGEEPSTEESPATEADGEAAGESDNENTNETEEEE